MKKITVLIAFAAFILASPNSQAQSFAEGDNVLNLTIGFGSGYYGGADYSHSPAFGVSFEHGFWDDLINGDFSIGIGGYFGFSTAKYETNWNGNRWGWKYTDIATGARGTFHWTGVENLDTYAGLHLGARIVTSSEIGNHTGNFGGAETGGVYTSPFVGARYYFTDAFCVVGEAGYGLGAINIGVGFKF